jgi:hypothetical protein
MCSVLKGVLYYCWSICLWFYVWHRWFWCWVYGSYNMSQSKWFYDTFSDTALEQHVWFIVRGAWVSQIRAMEHSGHMDLRSSVRRGIVIGRCVCVLLCVVWREGWGWVRLEWTCPERACLKLVSAPSFYSLREDSYKMTRAWYVALRWLEPYYNI